ncbi:MAG: choice-of-anchor tandem repeat GloVer-containing protein [Candidatus Cybelea sp.]
MKTRLLSHYALSSCVAAAMLAGCGGSPPPIGAAGTLPQSRAPSGYGYDTLYSFGSGPDGQQPKAGLINLNGTLYGTTYKGGKYGAGTVFSTSTSGSEKVLYSFNTYSKDNDGANPSASLIAVKGLLYGTTEYGGREAYYGTVFRISTAGKEKVLHRFLGRYSQYGYDGANPIASLVDVKGKLYGTTYSGGANQYYGTVFRISTNGREKVLHSFIPYSDGANPAANLVDVNGTLYGTTVDGGSLLSIGGGTVFNISKTGAEKVIYSFGYYGPDGSFPATGVINVGGTLYGTVPYGGAIGNGTVVSMTTSGNLTLLHDFNTEYDGNQPDAPLLNVQGTLYGTTDKGGSYGKGTVFSVTLSGNETVLHSFGFGSDGATPVAGLIDVNGTLYGTTSAGGTYGDGTVFALKP